MSCFTSERDVLTSGLRTKGVYNSYQSGGNWQKKVAVQTAGFGFGAAGAMVLGGAAAKFVLGLALASTPLGWVIVIGVGLSAGYAAGVAGDAFGQGVANKAYDVGSFLNTL